MTNELRHLILISVDALRFDALSSERSRQYLRRFGLDELSDTPSLDRLARTGFRFHSCRTVAPLTTPSHAAMLTGLYPPNNGVRLMVSQSLADENLTLAGMFRERGFATLSSIDADPVFNLAGLHRGFETSYPLETPDEEVLEELRRVDRARGQGFVFFHLNDVHYPYGLIQRPVSPNENREFFRDFLSLADQAGLRLSKSEKRALERGSVEALSRNRTALMERMLQKGSSAAELFPRYLKGVNRFDGKRFSRLLQGLRKRRLLEKSLLVVTADHGDMVLPGHHLPKAYVPACGSRFGHCHCVMEELLRVPLIFWSQTRGFRGGESDLPVSIVDIAPTLLGVFGIRPNRLLDGVDRSRFFFRSPANPSAESWRRPSDSYAEAWHEDWKASKSYLARTAPLTAEGKIEGPLPRMQGNPILYQQTLRQGPLKLVLTLGSGPALYHTERDPFETVNLLEFHAIDHEFRSVATSLHKKLSRMGKVRESRARPSGPRAGSKLLLQLEALGYL